MGYTALVTGPNRGIGLGLVEQLAATRNPHASALAKLGERFNRKVYPIAMEVVDEASVAVCPSR